jgi:hypothetical protein
VPEAKANDDWLYRALEALLPHKDGLFLHFQQLYGELFGTAFDILLYDITSTTATNWDYDMTLIGCRVPIGGSPRLRNAGRSRLFIPFSPAAGRCRV